MDDAVLYHILLFEVLLAMLVKAEFWLLAYFHIFSVFSLRRVFCTYEGLAALLSTW